MPPHIPVEAFEFTVEQQLRLRVLEDAVTKMDRKDLENMLMIAVRQEMIHSNIIKKIAKSDYE